METQKKQPENLFKEKPKLATETVLNYYPDPNQKDEGILKKAWKQPVGKVIIVAAGSTVLLYSTGALLRLLAWVRRGYNDFNDSAGKK